MTFLNAVMSRRRMILTASLLISLLGLTAWFQMPRQEDPQMPEYWGNVVALLPGADAETVERLLLEPLEDHLAEVDEIAKITSEAMNEMTLINLELEPGVDTDEIWDDVEEVLEEAWQEFPEGATAPRLNPHLNDQESIVLSISGTNELLELEQAARDLKKELLALAEVSEVRLIGEPGEQVTIELDDAEARRLGLDPRRVAAELGARSRIIPGGSVKLAGLSVNLRPQTDFQSLDEIRNTAVILPSGAAMPLSEIARIHHGPESPLKALMRHNGKRAVGLGLIARPGIHLTAFGEAVKARVAELAPGMAPLEVEYLIYQPERVQARLNNLGVSLLAGIMIVAAVLLVFMGFRLGLVVASVIPLVAFSSLAIYAMGGGMLQQISISALVIALGMLVDNAIVIAENVQWRVDQGSTPHQAAYDAVRELALPLGSATATTLAAFVPMLISKGTTADFTRALPMVIMLTLTISYLFAVFVTPILSELLLRKRKRKTESDSQISEKLAHLAINRPRLVLSLALVMVSLSVVGMGMVKQQFFPSSDRNQMIVDLALPEGSHLDSTNEASLALERALMAREEVVNTSAFLGRSAPHFYYNLNTVPWSPHFGQLVVKTVDTQSVESLIQFTREFANEQLAGIEVVPRRLEQGPPVDNPVEVRLFSSDLAALEEASGMVLAALRQIPGTANVRHNLSTGAPSLKFGIDDAAAARHGLTRADVATTLYGKTRGLAVGQYRVGDDPVPVVVRSSAGESYAVSDLEAVDVAPIGGKAVPLAQVAGLELEWRPAVIRHRDRSRTAVVSSQLTEGVAFSEILAALSPEMEAMTLPPGVNWEFGGMGEGSAEANGSMAVAMPIGLLLLFGILLAEFNSFRRVFIILVTVPLAATGVVPGLLIAGQPFGFMSLLGVIALVGVVVNNAIVLLDVTDKGLARGLSVAEAVREAVRRRTRPILLTTLTTITGLMPLALSGSSLWPPLAWAMISGLLASTLLTLLVAPSLYVVLFTPKKKRKTATTLVPASALVIFGLMVLPVDLEAGEPVQMTLEQVMEQSRNRPAANAVVDLADAADQEALAVKRSAMLPTAGGLTRVNRVNDVPTITTPAGQLELGEETATTFDFQITQPILDPSIRFHQTPAAQHRAKAERLDAQRTMEQLAAGAATAFLEVVALDAALGATDSYIHSLEERLTESRSRVKLGRSLEIEVLQIRLDLDAARQDRLALQNRREVATWQLGRTIGRKTPVEPLFDQPEPALPVLEDLLQQAHLRLDLAALDQQILSSKRQIKAIGAERLPKLEAIASYSWADGDAFRDGSNWQGALQLSWSPFASGTRKPRMAAARYRTEALEKEMLENSREVDLEIRSAWAAMNTAKGAVTVAQTGVELARETLRVQQERHRNGRITINDLLESEAALRRQQTDLVVARIRVTSAYVNLRLAAGQL